MAVTKVVINNRDGEARIADNMDAYNSLSITPPPPDEDMTNVNKNAPGFSRIVFREGKPAKSDFFQEPQSTTLGSGEKPAEIPEGILSTARNNFGAPEVDIQDNTILKIGDMEVTAKVAAKMGYIDKRGNVFYEKGELGGPRETPQTQQQVTPQAAQENTPPNPPQIKPQVDATISGMYEKAGQDIVDSVMVKIASRDGLSQRELHDFAAMLREPAENVEAKIKDIHKGFTDQARAYLYTLDREVDSGDVLEWASENLPEGELSMIKQLQFHGNLEGYRDVLDRYLQVSISPAKRSRLEAQGWEFYQTDGEWMAKHERYGDVRVKSALKVRLFG